jgi:hypothetical protein
MAYQERITLPSPTQLIRRRRKSAGRAFSTSRVLMQLDSLTASTCSGAKPAERSCISNSCG